MIKKIIKEPLVHFLFAGILLFLFFDKFSSNNYAKESNTIVVNKNALLNLMQYRSKVFKTNFFENKLNNLNKTERKQLIDDYVLEEVLFREAKKLNLDENDYIIKRRLIQKIDFIYKNRVENDIIITKDSLIKYFENNKEQYRVPSLFTFTHVFFKADDKQFQKALNRAMVFRKKTKNKFIDFNQSTQFGDRFLYHTYYVDRDINYIIGHFGRDFAQSISQFSANKHEWKGPFKSEYGYHLVLLTTKKENGLPNFEKVKSVVKEDYKQVYKNKLKKDLIKSIIKEYNIVIDY